MLVTFEVVVVLVKAETQVVVGKVPGLNGAIKYTLPITSEEVYMLSSIEGLAIANRERLIPASIRTLPQVSPASI